jgi:hypothetical protein
MQALTLQKGIHEFCYSIEGTRMLLPIHRESLVVD